MQVTAGVWWLVAGGVLYTGGVPLFLLDAAYYQQGVGAVFHLVRRDRYGRRCSVVPAPRCRLDAGIGAVFHLLRRGEGRGRGRGREGRREARGGRAWSDAPPSPA